MKNIGLIFYQLLILFNSYRFGLCQRFDYDANLELVLIDGLEGRRWESVVLSKYKCTDMFIFRSAELNFICNGPFSSSDVEIVEVFGNVIRFSLQRGVNLLSFNLLFTMESSVQLFFGDIRSQQRGECGTSCRVDKLFQFQKETYESLNEERLKLLGRSVEVYTKNLNPRWFPRQKTVNFSKYGSNFPIQGIHLVLLSGTYNVSERIGTTNTSLCVLCSSNIITHYFVLLFSNVESASSFYTSVMIHLNKQIPCSIDWFSLEILQKVISSQ